MKKEFLEDILGVDVKLLFTFMNVYSEFGKLGNEAQKVLLWLAVNHHDTTSILLDSLTEEYSSLGIYINKIELLNDIDEALAFLASAPKRIRYTLTSPKRQRIFESITDFEGAAFNIDLLRDHLKERGFEISADDVYRLLRSLTLHGFLNEFRIGKVMHYQKAHGRG